MHEVALAQEIVRMVETAAARDRFAQVSSLRLEAGTLAGIEVSALRFALSAMVGGTCLEGATIQIDQPVGRGWCAHCAAEVAMSSRIEACPVCANYPLRPVSGQSLRVLDLVVVDEVR